MTVNVFMIWMCSDSSVQALVGSGFQSSMLNNAVSFVDDAMGDRFIERDAPRDLSAEPVASGLCLRSNAAS